MRNPLKDSIYVRSASDIDVDELLTGTKDKLREILQGTIGRLQECLKALDDGPHAESAVGPLSTTGVTLLILVARLELLEALKDRITPRPPVVLSEREARRRVDEHWKREGRSYSRWDVSAAITGLKDDGLLKLRRMPKGNRCRYTFIKRPEQYPHAYEAFRRLADYFRVDIGATGTSVVGDWDNVRPDPPRLVVTQPVAKRPTGTQTARPTTIPVVDRE